MDKSNSNDTLSFNPSYHKHQIDTCIQSFSKIILTASNAMFPKSLSSIKSTLLQYSLSGNLNNYYIRPIAYKLFLNIFPSSSSDYLSQWITSTIKQRASYHSSMNSLINIKKLTGDPLGGWNSFYEDSEIKKLITLDVNRTFQENELFNRTTMKDLMNNILLLWSKENKEICYKQGMNEILAMLIYSLYPFYCKNSDNKERKTMEIYVKEQKKYQRELYCFFHDETEFGADLYCLFTAIMKKGVSKLYNNPQQQSQSQPSIAITETYLMKKCNRIINEILMQYDPMLYSHFLNIDLACQMFLQRWLKCLFIREFHPKDTEVLWDALFAHDYRYDYKENNEEDQLAMIDYVCVGMIVFIKEELMTKDQNECFQRLFKYPPIESAMIIVKIAQGIEENIKKKKTMVIDKQQHQQQEKTIVNIKENDSQIKEFVPKKASVPFFTKISNSPLLPNTTTTTTNVIETQSKIQQEAHSPNSNETLLNQLEAIIHKYTLAINPNDTTQINTIISSLRTNLLPIKSYQNN